MTPLSSDHTSWLLSHVMMHLNLLLLEVMQKSKISCCVESIFLSTVTFLSLPPPKLSLFSRKSCDQLIFDSVMLKVVIVEGELEELLLL